MSSSYMMQHVDFYFPSLRDSQANQLSEMHSREEEEEKEEDCLLLSYISLKSVPDHLAAHSDTSCGGTSPRTVTLKLHQRSH